MRRWLRFLRRAPSDVHRSKRWADGSPRPKVWTDGKPFVWQMVRDLLRAK